MSLKNAIKGLVIVKPGGPLFSPPPVPVTSAPAPAPAPAPIVPALAVPVFGQGKSDPVPERPSEQDKGYDVIGKDGRL